MLGSLRNVQGWPSGYVECLERGTAGAPQTGVLSRLADALETTPAHLVGADLSRRPQSGHARSSPRLDALSSEQCAIYLALGGVGRFVSPSVNATDRPTSELRFR